MKPSITIMIALLILCAVCSCSKNSGDHPNEGSILRMYKTTYKDTIISYYIYDRDANNRLISMRDSTKTSQDKYNFVYGSNARL